MNALHLKQMFAVLFVLIGLVTLPATGKPQGHISLVRRDGPDDINNLLTEFRAKGSRMR
jgi:hypothetical protein